MFNQKMSMYQRLPIIHLFVLISIFVVPFHSKETLKSTQLTELFTKYGNEEFISGSNLHSLLNRVGLYDHAAGNSQKCPSAKSFLHRQNIKENDRINKSRFKVICPAILHQIEGLSCDQDKAKQPYVISKIHETQPLLSQYHGAVEATTDNAGNTSATSYNILNVKPKVWIASIVSIVVISLVGLAGVAVVPLVTKSFYNHVIQFLVALAVGSLMGDAMLHLLPHAIVASVLEKTGVKHQHDDTETIYKGLAALTGIYFFYLAEKLVAMISESRTEKKAQKESKAPSNNVSVRNRENEEREHELKHQQEGHEGHHPKVKKGNAGRYIRKDSVVGRNLSEALDASGEDVMTTGLGRKAMKAIDLQMTRVAEEAEDCNLDDVHETTCLTEKAENDVHAGSEEHVSSAKVEDGHGGHGHGHGHSHEVPGSIAAVAWMVILGDGLHNFSDGLAIGAAFAQGISGGISTAVAVFCHELPHELGDFAVLLKTGMKVKQALFYNMVSSLLCFVGMLIGIALGNVQEASYWIFAIAGGMFIYIALVDMLPELSQTNAKAGENRCIHFILHNVGLITGISIMLVIALYEETIKEYLDAELDKVDMSPIQNSTLPT